MREQDVTIRALQQEKDGALYKLRGQAEIHYGTYILYADSVDYNSDTGRLDRGWSRGARRRTQRRAC